MFSIRPSSTSVSDTTGYLLVAVILAAVALGFFGNAMLSSNAQRSTPPVPSVSDVKPVTGDDNNDGQISEDESGWNPCTMGNHRGTANGYDC